jgi:hypothetical protein
MQEKYNKSGVDNEVVDVGGFAIKLNSHASIQLLECSVAPFGGLTAFTMISRIIG